MNPTTAELTKILIHLPDDVEVNRKSMDAIYNAYTRGYEDAESGHDGVKNEQHAALSEAYQLGAKRSKDH